LIPLNQVRWLRQLAGNAAYLMPHCSDNGKSTHESLTPLTSMSATNFALLQNVKIFSSLSDAELGNLARTATTCSIAAGEEILQEGEAGNVMYVIQGGAVQIYTRNFDGADLVLQRLETGDAFGEQALLPGGSLRRNASARALHNVKLLVITREALLRALEMREDLSGHLREIGESQRMQRRRRLQESIFASLGAALPSGSFRFEIFQAGQTLFRHGEAGDRVYLILSGAAQVTAIHDGAEDKFTELRAGQFVGQLSTLRDEPRSETVSAMTDLETASIDGRYFRELHQRVPALRSLSQSLSNIYLLPSSDLVVLQSGQVDGEPVLSSTHHIGDTIVLTIRFLNRPSFIARLLTPGSEGTEVRFEVPGHSIYRGLTISDRKITAIYSEGEWLKAGEALAAMLQGRELQEWEIRLFEDTGSFSREDVHRVYESKEAVCACSNVTYGQLDEAFRLGCSSIEAISARTGATRVCGGCIPLINEMLGRTDFTPARIVDVLSLTRAVRSFRLRAIEVPLASYEPGQYILVQARIDGRWIQRPYTLSAPFDESGEYEITVKRERDGVFSRWLFERANTNYPIRISTPLGQFCLPEDNDRDIICLVGGIGVTPALCMARSHVSKARHFRLHIEYSVSNMEDALCQNELLELPKMNPRLSVRVRCTKADGRLTRADIHLLLARSPDALFYLCGSERFLEGVTSLLRDCGVIANCIKTETFVAAGEEPRPVAPEAPASSLSHVSVEERPKTALEEAELLLRDYYSSIGAGNVIQPRLLHIRDEFSRTGTYTQTPDELIFAGRIAWRNSVRCIGRLYWQGLTVRDFRHVRTTDEMFAAIFEHMELATNGGNIRPVMTVFPPEMAGQPGYRIWSPQFFRYAGYAEQSGSVIGDPANIEFTKVAISLGWRPPMRRTGFDLLPLVVQAAGQRPEFREVPRHLVLEVDIVHPDHLWFTDLGLKWYAVPAVSNMCFDASGVRYPAAPFNGWYMGTEIGARNFSDTYRYNLLPEIARRMGLDTARESSLWKDRALVELNVAVLYSYEQAGVKMMDHHTAVQSFDRFEETEKGAGRPVHGRWGWLVPPLSGSTVSVFHRDWPDIEIKPNYFVQPDPWQGSAYTAPAAPNDFM
jgi:nitric-oxide synthase, bacterial